MTGPLDRWLGELRSVIAARVAEREPGRAPPSPPLDLRLDAALGLAALQRSFVWTCVAASIDPHLHPQLVTVGGADGRRGLSVATYAALLGIPADEAIALTAWLVGRPPVVRLGLIAPALDGLVGAATPFAPAPRLCTYLAGDDALDPALGGDGAVVAVPDLLRHDPAQAATLDRLTTALGADRPGPLIVVGPRGVGRRTAIAIAAACHQRSAVCLDADRVAPRGLDGAVRALVREAVLRGAVPIVANLDGHRDDQAEAPARIVGRVLDELALACAITTSDDGLEVPSRHPVRRYRLTAPSTTTRIELWSDALVGHDARVAPTDLQELAVAYRLGAGGVQAAVAAAAVEEPGPLDRDALVAGIRSSLADRFGGLAERLDTTASWDGVILPTDTHDQLRALVARVRHAYRVFEEWKFPRDTARGGGVAALFSGPPGTGKTLVAGLCARELGRDLYRVDLSKIVSKWVGETEKQLGQVFEAAEAGHTLLLFDEADALFAKRTEVKSSSDRYANLEVNYLLQRIETFGGVTILTTNLDTSIDPALRRRLAAHVVFWPPDRDERAALWRRFLATGVPVVAGIDDDALAADFPDMTGANIRNAVLAAAFLAAAGPGVIDQALLMRAGRAEYRAMGRVLGGRS